MNAVILLGYSATSWGAGFGIARSSHLLSTRLSNPWVRHCHLRDEKPNLFETVQELAERAVTDAVVLPYFFDPAHEALDIVAVELTRAQKLTPQMRLLLGPTLGHDERIVDLLVQRLAETGSYGLCRISS